MGLLIATFCACSFEFDGSSFVPVINIETDHKLRLDDEGFYTISLCAGEHYLINCDLGDYDGEDYYIEIEKQIETDLISLDGTEIIVADDAADGEQFVIFLILKKQGEDKNISKQEIRINVSDECED